MKDPLILSLSKHEGYGAGRPTRFAHTPVMISTWPRRKSATALVVSSTSSVSRDVFEDKWTVSEKIEMMMKIISTRTRLKFSELFEKAANRAEVVCTFLALLELIRLKQIACAQPEPFAEIEISRAVAPVAETENQATAEASPGPVESAPAEPAPMPENPEPQLS